MSFQKWKEEEETTTFTLFVRPKGETTGPANGTLYLLE